jgi:hypothetical protein
VSTAARASAASDEGIEFFEKRIRPVLVEHCYGCHAADAEQVHGGLLLDSRAGMRRGGDSGAAVSPGAPSESLLLEAIKHESFEMPPDQRLPDEVIADFERWIQMGAPDPREGPSHRSTTGVDIARGRQFWSLRPPQVASPPEVDDTAWPRTGIDRFVLSQLESRGLRPVSDADRETLIRRVYYALIGLPPTPREIDEFLRNSSDTPDALDRIVDRLLASPHFGERWGRHWLDVVRFAESSGGGRTLLFSEAWRYRDYVISAFNDDVAFDQFIQQQIAGDLLATDDWREKRRNLTATAFLVLGPTNYELQDKDVLEMDIVDEQLDTIGKALLGMTLGCARCHDHKFDPIPTRDYYALAGIFKSTQSVVHDNVSKWNEIELPTSPEEEAVIRRQEKELASLEQQVASLQSALQKAGGDPTAVDTAKSIDPASLPGIVVDDTQAIRQGSWAKSQSVPGVRPGLCRSRLPACRCKRVKHCLSRQAAGTRRLRNPDLLYASREPLVEGPCSYLSPRWRDDRLRRSTETRFRKHDDPFGGIL